MKLNDQITELIESFKLPEDVPKTVLESMTALESQGVSPGISVDEKAPDFRLLNPIGKEVSLSEKLANGPVVLSFYRGEWCPFCNLELKALQDVLPSIKAVGASLVAISPQNPSNALSLTEKHALKFDVLSDPTQKAIREYRLQFTVPDKVKEIYMKVFNLDVGKENPDGSWDLPVPATFVLDQEGIVRVRHVSMNYMTRMEPEDIMKALKALS